MVEAGQGTVVDGEAQRLLRRHAQGLGEGRADRPAVADADDVAPGVAPGKPLDGLGDAAGECGEALAARRLLLGGRQPEAVPGAAALLGELGVAEALPGSEVLLRQQGLDLKARRGDRCCVPVMAQNRLAVARVRDSGVTTQAASCGRPAASARNSAASPQSQSTSRLP
jgi:hypothetical protein